MNRFPCAVLLKVGLDFTLGGVLGPITDTGPLDEKREFEYIPFPEWSSRTKTGRRPESELNKYGVCLWTYGDLPGINHPDKMLSDYLPYDKVKVDGESWYKPQNLVPHNDPNFRNATSGEYWRGTKRPGQSGRKHGRLPVIWRSIKPEDVEAKGLWIFFKEALAPFTARSDFNSMSMQQHRRYGFYIIGHMLVKKFVDIAKQGWESAIEHYTEDRSAIVENFHFRRGRDEPLVVVGLQDKTCLYKRAIPLKVVIEGRKTVTEPGKLLNVRENDQVRFKYIYDQDVVSNILDMDP